jgi:outer membrane biosynthesis protein TonB
MSTPSDPRTRNKLGTGYPFSRSLHTSGLSAPGHVAAKTDVPFTAASGTIAVSEAMTWLHPLKKVPTSSRNSIWLMALISLGIHGLLMLMPIPSEQKPTPPKPEKRIRVTQLQTQPKLPVVKASPPPSPILQKTPPLPKPVTRPRTIIPPAPRASQIPSEPKPKETPPATKPKETPPAPQPKVQAAPTKPQPTPQATPAPTLSSTALYSNANPWENFPKYPTAKPGCFQKNFCIQTGAKLDEVATYFEKELLANQFQWKPTIQEGNTKVYQVSAKNGATQFLSLIFAGGDEGTVYVLGENALSLGDFKKAVEVPSEIADILTAVGLESQNVEATYFTEPDKFYPSGALRPEISSISIIPDQPSDTLMDAFLKTNLQNNGYEVSEPKSPYGGGGVYEVKKDKLKLYFNLVPTKDGAGTIVVIWGSPPV